MISAITDRLRPIYTEVDEYARSVQSHTEAMASRDLETILAVGILLFEDTRRRHRDWHEDVERKRRPYRVEDAEAFAAEYRTWKECTEFWLKQTREFERMGYILENAAKLRRLNDELASVDLDVHGLLASFARLESGSGKSLDEFFHAVPSQNQ